MFIIFCFAIDQEAFIRHSFFLLMSQPSPVVIVQVTDAMKQGTCCCIGNKLYADIRQPLLMAGSIS
jgi:hypothetical protein